LWPVFYARVLGVANLVAVRLAGVGDPEVAIAGKPDCYGPGLLRTFTRPFIGLHPKVRK